MPNPRPLLWAQSALFVLIIGLPIVGWAVGWDPAGPTSENRVLAKPPTLAWRWRVVAAFPERCDAYWKDHFGFRQSLIASHSFLSLRLLHVSPTPNVILGRDGWLFYGGEGALDAYRAAQPMTADELDTWVSILEQWRRSLAGLGIEFVVAVAPEKQSIYPEYLPPSLKRWGARTRYDQLATALAARTSVTFLDLRPVMLDVKAREQAYFRWDTHWTAVGAQHAARAILLALRPRLAGLTIHRLGDYRRQSHPVPGDLVRMLGLRNVMENDSIELVPKHRFCARRAEAPRLDLPPRLPDEKRPFALECHDAPHPRALMLHDSFGMRLAPFLSESFERLACVRWAITRAGGVLLQAERPNVVILEMAERHLSMATPPGVPMSVMEAAKRLRL